MYECYRSYYIIMAKRKRPQVQQRGGNYLACNCLSTGFCTVRRESRSSCKFGDIHYRGRGGGNNGDRVLTQVD